MGDTLWWWRESGIVLGDVFLLAAGVTLLIHFLLDGRWGGATVGAVFFLIGLVVCFRMPYKIGIGPGNGLVRRTLAGRRVHYLEDLRRIERQASPTRRICRGSIRTPQRNA
jgi:hypothetical protein